MPPLRLSGPAPGDLPPLRLSGPANKAPAYPLSPAGTARAPGTPAGAGTATASDTAAASDIAPGHGPSATSTTASGSPTAATPKPTRLVTVLPPAPAPGSPAALLPPPSSYLSSAWNVWPHAWAFVPTLWSAWYRDLVLQSRPATPAERAGTEPTLPTRPDQPEATPTAPVVTSPPTRLTDQDIAVLPAPRLVRRRRYNLVISGVGILAATWAADRLLANGLSPKPETWLPLVGPWILLAQQSALAAPSAQVQGLLVVDGILQAGGLSMALLGFVLTTRQYVVTVDPMRNDLAPQKAP